MPTQSPRGTPSAPGEDSGDSVRSGVDTSASGSTLPGRSGTGDTAATFAATLVDEWVHAGLSDAVLCPGSRSTPMALALVNDSRVHLHVHHDERSASFMALGLSLTTGRPTALLCTSGTAAVEFHPAVVEAHHSNVPLLVLTADRPPELHNVGAPQTIDQRGLYGNAARWFCAPGVPSLRSAETWRDLASEAWSRATGRRPGPVHLNLAFRDPLVGEAGELPGRSDRVAPVGEPAVGWTSTDLDRIYDAVSGKNGVIVAGIHAARRQEDSREIHLLADQLGWPVIADGPSGCRIEVLGCITAFDSLLKCDNFVAGHRPEVILRFGGLLASKALNGWIRDSTAHKIGIDPMQEIADPDKVFTQKFVIDPATACAQLRSRTPKRAPAAWRLGWTTAERVAVDAIDATLSAHAEATEPAAAVDLFTLLSDGGTVVVSSSMPIRDAESFAPPRSELTVLANRGANGIDGVTSTAVGAALDGSPTALLIGDVAFLHDSNALLGLAQRHVNLVIVLIDNRGGGIFSFLPQRGAIGSGQFERIFGTPHEVDLVGLCAAHRISAERVSTRTGVQAAIAGALTRGGPRVVIVETDREANRLLHEELQDAVKVALERPHSVAR